MLLKASHVSVQFGGLKALSDFSLEIQRGDLKGLIGPNGAGKTTAFNVLTGVYSPTSGEVMVGGVRCNGRVPHEINRLGVARTFQNIRLFKQLSALDNIRVALLAESNPLFSRTVIQKLQNQQAPMSWFAKSADAFNNYYDWWRALLLTPGFLAEETQIIAEAESLLTVMGLSHRRDEAARNLPYGEQRRLEIARALGTKPRVLLLDEPAAGMNPTEKAELMVLIRELRQRFDLGILLIEHDMKLVMGICEDITVLDHGETIAVGKPESVRRDPKVIEAYLGETSTEQKSVDVQNMSAVQKDGAQPTVQPSEILKVANLAVSYGAITALRGIDLNVRKGEIVALIGGNGAGKTSTLRGISGMVRPQRGQIQFFGEDTTTFKAHQLVPRGLAHAPEGRGIFLNLSVLENLRLGAYLRRDVAEIAADEAYCFELFPRLKERRQQIAGTLSGGEQQMLAISRALMSRPRLLLLDEPSLGLAPQVVEKIFEILRTVNARGMSILLVEQNAHLALHLAHRGYVLETGEIVMTGTGAELLNNPEIRKAYLGDV